MLKLYPSASKRPSSRRANALLVLALLAVAWITYSYLTNNPRLENTLVQATFISLLVGFNIAECMWPVISLNDQVLLQHQTLWFPKQYRLGDIEGLSEDSLFLYVNQSNRKVAIDVSKLDNSSLAKIRRLTQKAK